jgi:SpoU rRNA methylase family enzyme
MMMIMSMGWDYISELWPPTGLRVLFIPQLTDVSEVHTSSIVLMMEAIHSSETSVYSTRLHSPKSQKAVLFILAAVRTWNLTKLKLHVFICTIIVRERINEFSWYLACLLLRTRKGFCKGRNFEKLPRVRIPVRAVSVARKLSLMEELRHDESCWFLRGYYRSKGQNHESCPGFESRWT